MSSKTRLKILAAPAPSLLETFFNEWCDNNPNIKVIISTSYIINSGYHLSVVYEEIE